MQEHDKLNPAEMPDHVEKFITVQISGRARAVEIMRKALLDEINGTIIFCSGLMGKRKPKTQVHETQVS